MDNTVHLVCLQVDSHEGWLPRSQLVGEAAEGPHVDPFRVREALEHLRSRPEQGTLLRVALAGLLGEKGGQAQVTDLDLPVSAEQNVVRLDIPVQDVRLVHFGQTKRHFIERVSTKLL